MAGVWWASGFTQEVRTMQGSVEDNEDAVIVLRRDVFSLRERAAAGDATGKATERRLDSIDGTLRRIEEKLDRATRQGNRQ